MFRWGMCVRINVCGCVVGVCVGEERVNIGVCVIPWGECVGDGVGKMGILVCVITWGECVGDGMGRGCMFRWGMCV